MRKSSSISWEGLTALQQQYLIRQSKPSSLRQIVRASLIALAIALLCVVLTGCGGQNKAAPAPMGPMPVSVFKAQQADVPMAGQWVGTMDGFVNAQIQPQVSGYLIRQTYREGSPVTKGQVLFEIDPRPFQALVDQAKGQLEQAQGQVAQAQAQVAQAQAQLGLAQINVTRDTPLAQARAVAQSQLDNDRQQAKQGEAAVRSAQANVSSAQAGVTAAQAALETAKLNLGFTHVRSLIDGVAGQATTQVGNLVSPQSVLTSVSQLNPIKVYFSISDTEYLGLTRQARQKGGDLLSEKTSVPLTLTLANGQVQPQKGQLVWVDRQMNQQTGAIRLAASFPNPGNVLRPGQFARVSAVTELRRGAILVPQIAVVDMQGMKQVYTVGPGNKVHVVNVKLGPEYKNDWVVESGLDPGASVITDNLQKLKEGVPVGPQEKSSDTAPTSSTNDSAGK
ncbi:MAG: efflux RND transporter periplasmic adaptor subunit [Bryobacteraceae bacterium]